MTEVTLHTDMHDTDSEIGVNFQVHWLLAEFGSLHSIHWMRSSFPWHVILNPQANHTASNPSDCSNLQIPLLSSLAFNSSCDHIGGEASLQTKLVEVMKFQVSYLKSWKMMLSKCYTQCASKFGKLSSGHRTGIGQLSYQSQRKAIPKNAQTSAQLHSSHTLVK